MDDIQWGGASNPNGTFTRNVQGIRALPTHHTSQLHAMDLKFHIQVRKEVLMMHERAHVSLSSFGHDFGGVFDLSHSGARASAGAWVLLAPAPGYTWRPRQRPRQAKFVLGFFWEV